MPRIPIEELKKDIVIKTRLKGNDLSFHTTWGLFSPEKIDAGTEMLIEAVDAKPGASVLDLGCGYGAIGIALAKAEPTARIEMIDKDFVAVEYAKKNAGLNKTPNAAATLSNGFDQVPRDARFDLIVSNLPAKISKEYFWILFAEAKERLADGGAIVVVTIAGLRRFVEKNFRIIFENYKLLESKKTYFVAQATKTTRS